MIQWLGLGCLRCPHQSHLASESGSRTELPGRLPESHFERSHPASPTWERHLQSLLLEKSCPESHLWSLPASLKMTRLPVAGQCQTRKRESRSRKSHRKSRWMSQYCDILVSRFLSLWCEMKQASISNHEEIHLRLRASSTEALATRPR